MTKKKAVEVDAGSDHRNKFVKLLNRAAQNYSKWEVFTDFLKLTAISISNSDSYFISTDKETFDARETEYKRVINKYNKPERMIFPQLLAELTMELEDTCSVQGKYVDVLGELFHSMDFQDEWKAQFFTPQLVSDMSGKILVGIDKAEQAIKEKGFVTVNEPCCGGGSMIFGCLNALREYGLNPCTQALVIAADLDARCVHMTYIQLSLYGIPAVVFQQNTLTREKFDKPWYTPIFTVYGWKYKMNRWLNQTKAGGEHIENSV